jgi:signal transduction histidine kinase/CheY-like chemotaxis protein
MKLKKIKAGQILRRNYREIIFVFAAFALMAFFAYFFIGRMFRNNLYHRAEEIILTAGANVRAGLSEAETTLLNSYYIVQAMLERNAPKQEIFDYLLATTEWMRRQDQGLLGFYGIYGYINGEFYDSIGLNPGSDYIPQRRPWYQTAVRSGNVVAYTMPYTDTRTGNIIISAVRNVDVQGDIAGLLITDINISWLVEYVNSLTPANTSGYGMLISQNMALMAHPDSSVMGLQLQDLGGDYTEIARELRRGENVFARRIKDQDGTSAIVFFSRIFNGWYVGIVTPLLEFYQDLYLSATILVLLGTILSLSLCFILLRLSAARLRADEDSKSKSSFLANMSHEIRTPMNAITGMAELMLRGVLSDETRSYAQDIKQAGNNLLSIINDILDFSKIEAGKLEIIPIKYLLSSLVNDAVNIIRMRLIEKSIRFYTNIDSHTPNGLLGDEVRLRQIMLNLLSNAVKYSEKGHISLSIMVHKQEQGQVWLKIVVTDTGKGIKKEDQEKLFGEFVQVDTGKNRGIEGTGLGLAITKHLCVLMGGDISVESEYGKGSVFTAIIPQGIDSADSFAAVEDAARKKILVYEGRAVYAQSVCWSLENMGVPYTMVSTQEDFAEAMFRKEWYYVFSGYGLYEKIKPILEQPDEKFPGGKKPPLALMMEWGTEAHIPGVRFISLPVQSLSIANVLNGKPDKGYAASSSVSSAIRFIIPQARLLVVDDIPTNLKVAEGLLAPYHAKVDTCLSGVQAIEMVKRHHYDLVFMDHMMPEMDGIEATAAIREMKDGQFKSLPIIALTANAVVGMREMFIEKGFSDFLAKPIDISKLDEVINRWIPKEKREVGGIGSGNQGADHHPQPSAASPQSLIIPGIDVQRGIALTGGKEATFRRILALFCKDAEQRLSMLSKFADGSISLANEADIAAVVSQAHALKGVTANIGAAEVSAEAARLEAAAKAGNTALITEILPVLIQQLTELINNTNAALKD